MIVAEKCNSYRWIKQNDKLRPQELDLISEKETFCFGEETALTVSRNMNLHSENLIEVESNYFYLNW